MKNLNKEQPKKVVRSKCSRCGTMYIKYCKKCFGSNNKKLMVT